MASLLRKGINLEGRYGELYCRSFVIMMDELAN
jgi:hypothetical protein